MDMVTNYRRRTYRDKRKPTTLADLMESEMYIKVHIGLTGFFFALLVLVAMFGDHFLNLFGG
jgi:hypothetical protein